MNPNPQTQPKRPNLVKGTKSINLIPALTQEQVVVVQTKSQLNLGAAVSLFVLFLLTVVIVGFNILAKLELNKSKTALFKVENTLNQRESLISSNDEILKRVTLYSKIESTSVSTKDLIVYLQSVSSGMGTVSEIAIVDGSSFVITGDSNSLNDLSKLWFILGNDKFVESVNLKDVTKSPNSTRFTFEGKLKFEEFKETRKQTNNG
jgi:hypothetical protein